jgi:hypothetical protein
VAEKEVPQDLIDDIDTFLDKNKQSDEAYEYALGILEELGYTAIWGDQDPFCP